MALCDWPAWALFLCDWQSGGPQSSESSWGTGLQATWIPCAGEVDAKIPVQRESGEVHARVPCAGQPQGRWTAWSPAQGDMRGGAQRGPLCRGTSGEVHARESLQGAAVRARAPRHVLSSSKLRTPV